MTDELTHYVLVPCPLCGSIDLTIEVKSCPMIAATVACNHCGISLARSGPSQWFATLAATETWNKARPSNTSKNSFRVEVQSLNISSPCDQCSTRGWTNGYVDARSGRELSLAEASIPGYIEGYKAYITYKKVHNVQG